MYSRKLLTLTMLYLLSFTACSFDMEQEATETVDEQPDIVLFRSDIYVVEDSNIHIQAERIEIYSKLSKQIFHDVYFEQFDKADKMTMYGTADNIIMNSDSSDIEILGNIDITLQEDESRVQGDYLYWDNENDLLTSKDDDLISISRENGTSIAGVGFSVNTLKQIINFSGTTSGTIYTGDEPLVEEAPEEPSPSPDTAAAEQDTQASEVAEEPATTASPEPTKEAEEQAAAAAAAARAERDALEEELSKELK